MQKDIEITIAPGDLSDEQEIKRSLSVALKISLHTIKGYQILKRSIDARSRKVIYRLQVKVYIDEPFIEESHSYSYPDVKDKNLKYFIDIPALVGTGV